MDIIFWFSGTGNSLYAAKRLAAGLGDISMVQMSEDATSAVGGKGSKVGFVFPSYYGNLPRAVRNFIENLEILSDTYLFAIVTGGGVKTGSIVKLKVVLKEKDLHLSYGRGIFMKGNYIINYNPADPAKMDGTLDKVDKRLKKFAADISAGVVSVKSFPLTTDNLYKSIEELDAAFTANDSCTGCGLCERICPVSNISLSAESGKPKWLHHCEHCVACISWCAAQAIDYGDKTQSRRRYRNPRINAHELIRKSEV